jgi:hypothetical protein
MRTEINPIDMNAAKKSNRKINNCWWGYKCPQTWGTLKETLNPNIKFCHECKKDVFKTNSEEELVENIQLNRCMYFSENLIMSESEKNENTRRQSLGFMPIRPDSSPPSVSDDSLKKY